MKRLYIFLFLISYTVQSQDFSLVDAKVLSYPAYKSPESLAKRIEKDFSSDIDKTRAAFRWLTKYITYDYEQLKRGRRVIKFQYFSEEERIKKLSDITNNLVSTAFKKRKGVCEEYAQSLKKLCNLMGIESDVIKGNVRSSPREIGLPRKQTNHAWNIVKINNNWIIVDATWASGAVINGKWNRKFSNYYFNIPKNKIGKTHFPDNRKWQVVWNIPSRERYYNQALLYEPFLEKNIEITSHASGIILVKRNAFINLELKGLEKNSSIFYTFEESRYAQKPKMTTKNNMVSLVIPAPMKSTFLYVFQKSKLCAVFRIIVQ